MMTIPLWVRLAFWAVLLTGGAWLGWNVQSWRMDAAKLKTVQLQLDTERDQHAQSEAARINLASKLATEQGKIHEVVRESIRRVPVLVRDNRACDLDDETVSELNRARGYDK